MDNKSLINMDDSIGTDPSVVSVIDSLDVEPEVSTGKIGKNRKSNYKKPKEPKSKLKMILLALAILVLIGGVAFGLFYYLRLGNNKVSPLNQSDKTLDTISLFVGDKMSSDILSYGDFSTVDIATCTMDNSKVDTSKKGVYDFSITCGKTVYKGKVEVDEKIAFDIEGLLVYKKVNDQYSVNDFLNVSGDYEVSFKDENTLKENLSKDGGPYSVAISAKDKDDHEITIYSVLYTYQTMPQISLNCNKDNQTDRFSFNSSMTNMNKSLRMFHYVFENEDEYHKVTSQIKDGILNYENTEGLVVTNEDLKEITIISNLTNETLTSEYGSSFPSSYNLINNYYKNTKKFTCTN